MRGETKKNAVDSEENMAWEMWLHIRNVEGLDREDSVPTSSVFSYEVYV